MVLIIVGELVAGQVLGANGGAVEAEQATPFEDAIDDGLREVVVVKCSAPALGCLFVVNSIARRLMWRSLTT